MASSQKSGNIIIPWFNTNEWKNVYNSIVNESATYSSKLGALRLLRIWKTRAPRLPTSLEGTFIILNEVLRDKLYLSEDNLRFLYGSAILRFLNLYNTSGDWLIDLRHDLLPSKCMLETGLKVCLDWLKREYWEKQGATVTDYVICLNPDWRIEAAIRLHCQISLIQYLDQTKRLVELNDPTLMYEFKTIEDIVVIDVNMKIHNVLALLLEALSSYITNENTNGELVSVAIIQTGSMFSKEIFKDSNVKTIPNDFKLIWEPLLHFLYEKNMLIAFIKRLIEIISSSELIKRLTEIISGYTLQANKKRIANLWLTEIFKGLVLTKYIYDRYHKLPKHLHKETAKVLLSATIQNETPDLKQALDFDIDYYENIKEDLDTVTLNILEDDNLFTLQLKEYISKLRGSVNETRLEDHPNLFENSLQSIPNNK